MLNRATERYVCQVLLVFFGAGWLRFPLHWSRLVASEIAAPAYRGGFIARYYRFCVCVTKSKGAVYVRVK